MKVEHSLRLSLRMWVMAIASSLLLQIPSLTRAAEPPVDPKAKATASAAADTTVKAAVDALKKELSSKSLRPKCNYFTGENSDPLTDAILSKLESSPGSSVEENVYIKWQLLSGLPSHVKDRQIDRLIRVYAQAPRPIANPSLDPRMRSQLQGKVPHGKIKEADQEKVSDEIDKFNTQWAELVEKTMAPNKPILEYRNEIFMHLPPCGATVKAGIQDGYERASLGVSGAEIMTMTDGVCHNWAASGAPPAEMAEVKSIIDKIVQLMGGAKAQADEQNFDGTALALGVYNADAAVRTVGGPPPAFPPQVLVKIKSDGKGNWGWEAGPAAFMDVKKLHELGKYLADCMKSPDGGLKFKTPT